MKLNKYQTIYLLLCIGCFICLAMAIVVDVMAILVVFRDGRDEFLWIFILMTITITVLLISLVSLIAEFIGICKNATKSQDEKGAEENTNDEQTENQTEEIASEVVVESQQETTDNE